MSGGFNQTIGAYQCAVSPSPVMFRSFIGHLLLFLRLNLTKGRSHAGHMPYLWQGALSIVSQTLLIMGATMSPSLNSILVSLVSHRDVIDQIINDVVMEIERYSVLSPSLSLSAEIIKEAEVRRRTFLSG